MLGSAKSARREFRRLLALLAPRRLAHLEKPHALLSSTQHTKESSFILLVCASGSSLRQ
jgi:hypothetical protein